MGAPVLVATVETCGRPCVGSYSQVLTIPSLLLIKFHTRDVQITHQAHRFFHLSATQVTPPAGSAQTDTNRRK